MAPSEKEEEAVAADAEMKDAEAEAEPAAEGEDAGEPADAEPMDEEAGAAEGAEGAEEADADKDGADGEKAEKAEGEEAAAEEPAEPEAPKEPEPPKELEEDAPADGRPAVKGAVAASDWDATINVAASCGGKVLMALSDGGFQYLLAGVRANTGIKSGRYLYEVRIVESRNPLDSNIRQQQPVRGAPPPPRQLCTLGFSTAGSSLFVGGSDESVGFDSEGYFVSGKKRTRGGARMMPYSQVVGVLLNLDAKSPNANTISLFLDGKRASQPKPIPECLQGKVLFPTVNYKNMTLHLNFGSGVLAPMPFRCLTLQEAAAEDVVVAAPKKPADGKCEVVFPVGLPDEGTFDWLDDFLKRNPDYMELSSRSILDWGLKSGLPRQRGFSRNCNDHPLMEFGIRELDDDTVRQMIMSVAPVLKRNYVVMEVRDGLLEPGRKQLLQYFDSADFKRTALVVMGEPPEDYKAKMQQLALDEKKRKAGNEVKRKKGQDERRRPPPPPAGKPEKPEGEAAEEEKKEPEETLEEAVKKAEDAAVLTDEEKARWFRKNPVEDLTKKDLGQNFGRFTIPAKDEGFDDVKFEWQNAEKCAEYLKVWIGERKLTQKVEDLQPGTWFRDQYNSWTKQLQDWRQKHHQWQDDRWHSNKKRPWQGKQDKKEAEAKEEKAEKEEKEEGQEKAADEDASKEEAPKESEEGQPEKEAENGEPKEEDSKMDDGAEEVQVEDKDVFAVDDICDAGKGEPLFAKFTWEDWMLLSLRFEVHLLAHAYARDINDPERTSFHESHLAYYYGKYYKKQFNLQYYGVSSETELLQLIRDTMEVAPKNAILDPQLSDDTPLDNFVRLTEDHRRERTRRIDAGDETAALKFQKPQHRQQGGQQGGNRGNYQRGGQPQAQYSRAGPPNSRGPPGGAPPSRYGSAQGAARGAPGGYGGGGAGYGGGGGGYGGSRGGPPLGSRPAPAAPVSRGYGAPPPPSQSSSYGAGGQKRSYQPGSSGGGYPPNKQYRGSAPPPPSRGGSGYGGGSNYSGGGGYGGGYRR